LASAAVPNFPWANAAVESAAASAAPTMSLRSIGFPP
jgi:hypothetical protein